MREETEDDEGLVEEHGAEQHGSTLDIRLVEKRRFLIEHLLHVTFVTKGNHDQLHLVVPDTRHQTGHLPLFLRDFRSGLLFFVPPFTNTGLRQPRQKKEGNTSTE